MDIGVEVELATLRGCIGETLSGLTKHWAPPPQKKLKASTLPPSPSTQGRKRSGTKPRTLHNDL